MCIPKTCTSGYEVNFYGQCVPICGENAIFEWKNCICKKDYFMIDGKCAKCDEGTMFSYKAGKCMSVCGENAKFNS